MSSKSPAPTQLSRRMLICGSVALAVRPILAAKREAGHRFRTADFDVDLSIEYHDGYASNGFWFRDSLSNRQFCLSAQGEETTKCLANFRGSLAIAEYKVFPRGHSHPGPVLREYVRTVDRDTRLRDRPPVESTIKLTRGIGTDLQAFGYELSAEEESASGVHSPWCLFRQDLFLGFDRTPFLTIFWKHAVTSIRVLDLIPGEQTWPMIK